MTERSMLLLRVLPVVLLLAACSFGAPIGGGGEVQDLLPSVQASAVDGRVEFTLQVTNTTDRPIELRFNSGQSYDFRVLDGGEEIWRWSSDQMFTQALRSEELTPGGTLTYHAEWEPGEARSGELTVVGTLTSSSHPVEQSARFRLR